MSVVKRWDADLNEWVIISNGAMGYTGSQGYTGSRGTTGYTGSRGTTGYTGSLGYTGSQGAGYTGSQGVQGYTGSGGGVRVNGVRVTIDTTAPTTDLVANGELFIDLST